MGKLKGAIIGFGNVAANGHWPGYAESSDFEIVAVVDPSPERRKAAQKLKPDIATFTSFDELLQVRFTTPLDFVDICTPPSTHVKMAQECIRKGWHVICEKPLSLAVGDYTLWLDDQPLRRNVAVADAAVTDISIEEAHA